MNEKSKLTRRDFLKVSALGAAGAVLMPSALAAAPKSAKKKSSANDTIGIGFIGLGQQAMHLLAGFLTIDGVRSLSLQSWQDATSTTSKEPASRSA